jgi:hypothetical protein
MSVLIQYYTAMEEIWDRLVFVLITAWDITEVFPNASISEPDIAMFIRGMIPLHNTCAFTLNSQGYYSFLIFTGGISSIW